MQTLPRSTVSLAGTVISGLLFATSASAQTSPKMKMTTPIPESITTPARIEAGSVPSNFRRTMNCLFIQWVRLR